MKKLIFLFALALPTTECRGGVQQKQAANRPDGQSAETSDMDKPVDMTAIADSEFWNYCIENFDKDGDGMLSRREAAAVEEIGLFGHIERLRLARNVRSLAGLELFENLTKLSCGEARISSLDVSKNPLLNTLWCNGQNLSRLDVSKNPKLSALLCGDNNLDELDVSGNPELQDLYIRDNRISRLNVSGNPKLREIHLENNKLLHPELQALFRSLPDRSKEERGGEIYCADNPGAGELTDADKKIANDKGWHIQDWRQVISAHGYDFEEGKKYYADIDHTGIGLARPKYRDFNFADSPMIPLYDWNENDDWFVYLIVLARSKDFLELRADRDRTVRVPSKDYEFVTWEELLTKRIFSMDAPRYYFKKDTGGGYENFSKIIEESDDEWWYENNLFTVKKLDGDWARVEWCDISGKSSVVKGTYWVPWRNAAGQILIDISTSM